MTLLAPSLSMFGVAAAMNGGIPPLRLRSTYVFAVTALCGAVGAPLG
jgi:hypothetical protein